MDKQQELSGDRLTRYVVHDCYWCKTTSVVLVASLDPTIFCGVCDKCKKTNFRKVNGTT